MLKIKSNFVLLGMSFLAFNAAGCGGNPVTESNQRSSTVGENEDSEEAIDDQSDDETGDNFLLSGSASLSKNTKKLIRDFMKQISVVGKKDNAAQKAKEKALVECDKLDLLKAQIDETKNESTEVYKALGALDDDQDKLWLMRKKLREKKHQYSLDIVANAKDFQQYTKGELRCIRAEARREFGRAKPSDSVDQKRARVRGDILLTALNARIPYASPGGAGDKSVCYNRYLGLRQSISDTVASNIANDVDAVEAQTKKVKEAVKTVRRQAKAAGIKSLPSEKDLMVSANNICEADTEMAYDYPSEVPL